MSTPTLDYDMISTGMRKGRIEDWQWLTRDTDGDFTLWTYRPKLDRDGYWCFEDADIGDVKAKCAPLPFIPEIFVSDMELRGAQAIQIWEINYNFSWVDRNWGLLKTIEDTADMEEQLSLFE